ncbi:MAG: 50S ribosomal protein L13 [Candidatus Paceibacterota bacterium]
MKYTIDATGKKIGRLATEVASILMGKLDPNFARNVVSPVKVVVENASKIAVTDKKMKETTHNTYSGYPGGLKKETLLTVKTKKGMSEIVKVAVYGMLPKNKLRSIMIKNLKINE